MIQNRNSKILVTGAAGFIGSAVSEKIVNLGFETLGVDNLNDYYDPKLKLARIDRVKKNTNNSKNFNFLKLDLSKQNDVKKIFTYGPFKYIVHLAAQAGVRYSLINPSAYVESNINGFVNLLEGIKEIGGTEHFIYASSSSVYGGNVVLPFHERDRVDHPVSLYAATKKSNELLSFVYSNLYKIPSTGLRIFTVYGPWGRPDMAAFKFVNAILNGEKIEIYNNGDMLRDFTYIDDVVEGIVCLLDKKPTLNSLHSKNFLKKDVPYQILNLGNNSPELLMAFVSTIETCLGVKAKIELKPMQPGDVVSTYADMSAFSKHTGMKIKTSLKHRLKNFVVWYKQYYKK